MNYKIQMSSASAQKKKQEERNSKLIRELASLTGNKYCFECGQRGPTYVNITNGSFCCMHCSGLLRGLNPPHRVKSISMATFSSEEVEKLKNTGNDENGKIWLGLHDGPIKFEPVRLDENVKNHLIQKYENRKWYVSPSEIAEQKRLLEAHTRRDSVSGLSVNSHKSNQSAPANLQQATERKNEFVDFLGEDLMFATKEEPTIPNTRPPFAPFSSQSAFPLSSHTTTPQPLQFDLFGSPSTPTLPQAQSNPPAALPPRPTPSQDLFGGMNFFDARGPPTVTPPVKQQQPNFANFDAMFGNLKVAETPKTTSTPMPPTLPAVAPVSNGFMDLPINPVKPVATVSVKQEPVMEPVKLEEKKYDGPDYSALDSLYTVEDEPIDFFGFGKAKTAATNGLSAAADNTNTNSNGFAKSSTIGDFATPASVFNAPAGNSTLGLTPHPFLSMNSFNPTGQPVQERAPWEPIPSNSNNSGAAPVSNSNWNPFS